MSTAVVASLAFKWWSQGAEQDEYGVQILQSRGSEARGAKRPLHQGYDGQSGEKVDSEGTSRLRGNKSTHQIEKFRNKKGSFLDQYVVDSSENLSKLFEEHLSLYDSISMINIRKLGRYHDISVYEVLAILHHSDGGRSVRQDWNLNFIYWVYSTPWYYV